MPILRGVATVIVRAHSRSPNWDGPLRGWIDNRARQLRDERAVHAVVVVEGRDEADLPCWELGIRLADLDPAGSVVLRHLIADLELLKARPELITEADVPDLRRRL